MRGGSLAGVERGRKRAAVMACSRSRNRLLSFAAHDRVRLQRLPSSLRGGSVDGARSVTPKYYENPSHNKTPGLARARATKSVMPTGLSALSASLLLQ